jgi:preprotein translocase subunit SecY
MINTIAKAFTVREIRNKVLFTLALLALYRVGSHIPVPGINTQAVQSIQSNFGGSNVLGFLNLFSGGGLQRLAVFALGIMPYITASIILQLLTVVVPSLEKLQKEGEIGTARITQYTRYLTVALALAQSVGYVFLFRSFASSAGQSVVRGGFTAPHVFLIVIALTAGTVLLMWLGELITQRGIGNGISLLIFASIASRIPNGLQAWWTNSDQVFKVSMPFIALAVIAAVVFIQEGQRRIPVQYAKRVIGRRMQGGTQSYLPLRVNMAGVIPVIFAASLMAFPPTVGQLIPSLHGLANFFSPNGWHYILGESILIILFTYFYTAVTFNPVDQADNLKKYGGFIPGVRPGRPTAEFLDRILARLTFPGAIYLALVAALPTILINQTSANFFFGGTSLLIVVAVALDTMKQLEAQLMMRNYQGFLERGRSPGGPTAARRGALTGSAFGG